MVLGSSPSRCHNVFTQGEFMKMTVNGQEVTAPEKADINVIVNGTLVWFGPPPVLINLTGDCGSINTASGDVTVTGDCGTVETVSGDIEVGWNVGGNVSSISGNVEAQKIQGSVSTISGRVTSR